MPLLADSLAANHFAQSHPQNSDIQPQAPVIHVPHVQLELLLPSEVIAAIHLRPTRDARRDFMPAELARAVSREILRKQRPWTHQRHLATEYIPQLRQFVQAGGPEGLTHAAQTFRVGKKPSTAVPRIAHRTEFVEPERSSRIANPQLTEQNRRSHADADKGGHAGQQRA